MHGFLEYLKDSLFWHRHLIKAGCILVEDAVGALFKSLGITFTTFLGASVNASHWLIISGGFHLSYGIDLSLYYGSPEKWNH